jgi:alpha-L-fucosidase
MPAGRPTKLTPQIIEEVKRYLPKLVYFNILADCIGVHRFTIHRWIAKGKKLRDLEHPTEEDQLYIEFSDAIKKGIAEAEVELISQITNDKAWQAKAWTAERRFPERWSSGKQELKELNKKLKDLEDIINRAIGPQIKPES